MKRWKRGFGPGRKHGAKHPFAGRVTQHLLLNENLKYIIISWKFSFHFVSSYFNNFSWLLVFYKIPKRCCISWSGINLFLTMRRVSLLGKLACCCVPIHLERQTVWLWKCFFFDFDCFWKMKTIHEIKPSASLLTKC